MSLLKCLSVFQFMKNSLVHFAKKEISERLQLLQLSHACKKAHGKIKRDYIRRHAS